MTASTLNPQNIHFTKDGQTRYVKHGFSWQLALFGPITYVMRGQWLLALALLPLMYIAFWIMGFILVIGLNLNEDLALILALGSIFGLVGAFGNRFSARSYVKNGWKPVDRFPEDWNRPVLIPTAAPSVAPHTVV